MQTQKVNNKTFWKISVNLWSRQIVLAGHFSLFYDSDLEDKGV